MLQQGSWEIRRGFVIKKAVCGLSLPVKLAFVPKSKNQRIAITLTDLILSIRGASGTAKVADTPQNLQKCSCRGCPRMTSA
jgi:hypothetical protein